MSRASVVLPARLPAAIPCGDSNNRHRAGAACDLPHALLRRWCQTLYFQSLEFPMPAPAKHREAIVEAAATLFRRRGYCGTGLNDIVALSGAPKGSLYYYFPEGKSSIGAAAIALSSSRVVKTLEQLASQHRSAAKMVRGYATRSICRDGGGDFPQRQDRAAVRSAGPWRRSYPHAIGARPDSANRLGCRRRSSGHLAAGRAR